MNFAAVWKAPVVFLCQNNGYAISLPAHEQTASEDYAIKGKAYGVPAIKVDGNDLFAVREAVAEAAERARAGEGPTLIEAVTFRMGGHSTSDDPTVYVPKEEVDEWKQKDPIDRFERYLKAKGLLDEDGAAAMAKDCLAQIDKAAKAAAAVGPPALETIFSDVYAEIPAHLRAQGAAAFDLAKRLGDAAAGDGAFPL
jgi:pyruvate dehydrogenase E1 component alpha subunit/2-oxoisovalerate dehydrogenase E1 component alpha subunit